MGNVRMSLDCGKSETSTFGLLLVSDADVISNAGAYNRYKVASLRIELRELLGALSNTAILHVRLDGRTKNKAKVAIERSSCGEFVAK
jgi:hypothetical protein